MREGVVKSKSIGQLKSFGWWYRKMVIDLKWLERSSLPTFLFLLLLPLICNSADSYMSFFFYGWCHVANGIENWNPYRLAIGVWTLDWLLYWLVQFFFLLGSHHFDWISFHGDCNHRLDLECDRVFGIEAGPSLGADLVLHCRKYVDYWDEFQPHAQFGRVLSGLYQLVTSR